MRQALNIINKKTDDRFLYAIGLFVLLSICMERFPSVEDHSQNNIKTEIIASAAASNSYDIYHIR